MENNNQNSKEIKIVLSIIIPLLLIAALLVGIKIYKTAEQNKIDETVISVYTQLLDAPLSSFTNTDENGNVLVFEYDDTQYENQAEFCITKLELNKETGKLCDSSDDETDIFDMMQTVLADNGYYYYDKKVSEIRLDSGDIIKVNIDKESRVRSLEYDGVIYTEVEGNFSESFYEFEDYLSRYYDANDNVEEYEERLRNTVFYSSGFNIPMDDLLDAFFKDYEITVKPDRDDSDSYYISVSGPCYGYSFLYYIASGYQAYLKTNDVTIVYKYSVSKDEISAVNDVVDGYTIRDLYVYATVYNRH